jgi:hypothetical protein
MPPWRSMTRAFDGGGGIQVVVADRFVDREAQESPSRPFFP